MIETGEDNNNNDKTFDFPSKNDSKTSISTNGTNGSSGTHSLNGDNSSKTLETNTSQESTENSSIKKRVFIKEVKITKGELTEDSNENVYVEFTIWLSDGENWWEVLRRYSNFYALHTKLKSEYYSHLPALPSKSVIGGLFLNPSFIESRRKGLELYLQQLIAHPIFSKSDLFISFLSPTSHPINSDPIESPQYVRPTSISSLTPSLSAPIFLVPLLTESLLNYFSSITTELNSKLPPNFDLKNFYKRTCDNLSQFTSLSVQLKELSVAEKLFIWTQQKPSLEQVSQILNQCEEDIISILDTLGETFKQSEENLGVLLEFFSSTKEIIRDALNWHAKFESQSLDDLGTDIAALQSHIQDIENLVKQHEDKLLVQLDNSPTTQQPSNSEEPTPKKIIAQIKDWYTTIQIWSNIKRQLVNIKVKLTKECHFFPGYQVMLPRIFEVELDIDKHLEFYFEQTLLNFEQQLQQFYLDINEILHSTEEVPQDRIVQFERRLGLWRDSTQAWLNEIEKTNNFVGKSVLLRSAFRLSEEITKFQTQLEKKLIFKSLSITLQSVRLNFTPANVDDATELKEMT